VYSEEEAIKASTEYFNNNTLAATIFVNKYALKDNDGKILELTPSDMHNRIANELARIERSKFNNPLSKSEIFDYLDHFKKIIPQGGILFGVGNNYQYTSLANCFCCPPPVDSYGGIFFTDQAIAQLSKRRCGIGINISDLRPRGFTTKNAAGSSTGPISFAKRFASTVAEVGQNNRRGGGLLLMNVHHIDILPFINFKNNLSDNTAVNISIGITDEFIKAVKNDEEYEQRWPITNPQITRKISAKKVWNEIVKCSWNTGDPGIIFLDNIINESIPDCYSNEWKTSSTNVCGEIPLNPLGACVLTVVNAYSYVDNKFKNNASFNFDEFYHDAMIAHRILDDIIDLEIEKISKILDKINKDPEPDYIKSTEKIIWEQARNIYRNGRRVGLGLVGVADTLAALNKPYSMKSAKFLDKLYKTLKFAAYRSSIEIAKEIGPFPMFDWEKEKDNPFLNRIKNESIKINNEIIDGYDIFHDIEEYGRRNINCLTSSPTGTISLLAQVSSGIEPTQYINFKRKVKLTDDMINKYDDKDIEIDVDGNKFVSFMVEHPKFTEWKRITGKTKPEESPWYLSCAHDIKPEDRIKLQGKIQKHICNSISSTVNLPQNTPQKFIDDIFLLSHEVGLKGVTIYRDGSRKNIIQSANVDRDNIDHIIKTEAPRRPRELPCNVHHVTVKGRKYYVLVGLFGKNKEPYEIFCGPNNIMPNGITNGVIVKKRKGYYKAIFKEHDFEISPLMSSANEMEEGVTRLASTALRHGTEIYYLVKQLERVGEHSSLQDFCRAMARTLKKYIPENRKEENESCPSCGNQTLVRREGCPLCLTCSWSRCL